jgi:ERCC4-related helicase
VDEATRDALTTAARALEPVTEEQERLLGELLAWAEREAHRPDAKASVLLRFLDATCRPRGSWNDERVIVFTEYRDTQHWLHQLLVNHGVPDERIALILRGHGH